MSVKHYVSEWDFVTVIFCGFCIIDQNDLSACGTISLTLDLVTPLSVGFLC